MFVFFCIITVFPDGHNDDSEPLVDETPMSPVPDTEDSDSDSDYRPDDVPENHGDREAQIMPNARPRFTEDERKLVKLFFKTNYRSRPVTNEHVTELIQTHGTLKNKMNVVFANVQAKYRISAFSKYIRMWTR